MKCPYCNEEMKWGYIQSSHTIFWGEEKHKLSFRPHGPEEFTISRGGLGATVEANYCTRCGKIIIQF